MNIKLSTFTAVLFLTNFLLVKEMAIAPNKSSASSHIPVLHNLLLSFYQIVCWITIGVTKMGIGPALMAHPFENN